MRRGPLRDALLLVGTFALLLGGLFAYTQVWPPAVIVESGSMMHADSEVSYGRFGTIDPGDLVLVKRARSVEDVVTLVESGRESYGKAGDVIVYHAGGNEAATPIIHRAVGYVEVATREGAPAYRLRWAPDVACEGGATRETDARATWCVYGVEGVLVPSVPIGGRRGDDGEPTRFVPDQSGFFTKGDNPATNPDSDQAAGIAHDAGGRPSIVPLAWVTGKARAELPWVGLIKLSLAGKVNDPSAPAAWMRIGWAYAPVDLWVMLGVTLFVLVGVPLGFDVYHAIQRRRA